MAFEHLPAEIVSELALRFDLKTLLNFSLASRHLLAICESDQFWHRKFIYDFGEPRKIASERWKTRYEREIPGDLYSFGDSNKGVLGVFAGGPEPNPIHVPGVKVKYISAGERRSSVIDQDNNILVFGRNKYYQLGVGDYRNVFWEPTKVRDFKAVDVSSRGTRLLLTRYEDGTVWGTGFNPNLYPYPTKISDLDARAITEGSYNIFVIDKENNVWGYGSNTFGILGIGKAEQNSYYNFTLMPGIKAKAISAGSFHCLIIDLEGKVWGCGRTSSGELGLNGPFERPRPTLLFDSDFRAQSVSANSWHSLVLDSEGQVWASGGNDYGQLGIGSAGREQHSFVPVSIPVRCKAIATGPFHSVFIDVTGGVWTCGDNQDGKLGYTSGSDIVSIPTKIPGLIGKFASAGMSHTLVIGRMSLN